MPVSQDVRLATMRNHVDSRRDQVAVGKDAGAFRDPRHADMKDFLNFKIKRRESFRPFASSVLRDAMPDLFEQDDDLPFMMQVYQIREEKRALIPAVAHVDGSGRLQTVYEHTNPR